MRYRRLVASAAAALLTACHASSDDPPPTDNAARLQDLSIVLEVDKSKVIEEEKLLHDRLQDFAAERARLDKERREVVDKLAALSGNDKASRAQLAATARTLADQQDALTSREQAFEQSRLRLDDAKTRLLERLTQMVLLHDIPAEKRDAAVARDGMLKERERQMSQREDAVAAREKHAGQREADLAARDMAGMNDVHALLTELRQGGRGPSLGPVPANTAAPAPAQAPEAPEAGDVPATPTAVRQQHQAMQDILRNRGLLADDLPAAARDAMDAAAQAERRHDYTGARDALARARAQIDAVAVTQAFVQAKMARINTRFQDARATLSAASLKSIQGLLAEASAAFSDGYLDKANRKMNQINDLIAAQ